MSKNKLKRKTLEDFYVKASGQVLSERLPDNWRDLEDTTLDEFVVAKAWLPYESWSATELWSQINSVAYDFHSVYLETLEEVKTNE